MPLAPHTPLTSSLCKLSPVALPVKKVPTTCNCQNRKILRHLLSSSKLSFLLPPRTLAITSGGPVEAFSRLMGNSMGNALG